jgi:hypothetical protein
MNTDHINKYKANFRLQYHPPFQIPTHYPKKAAGFPPDVIVAPEQLIARQTPWCSGKGLVSCKLLTNTSKSSKGLKGSVNFLQEKVTFKPLFIAIAAINRIAF